MSATTGKQVKTQTVSQIVDLSKEYSVIGVARLEGISASVLQRIRKSLGKDAKIKVARNTLKELALTKSQRKKIKDLLPYIERVGSCGLIFTDMNPFTLQRVLQANRMPSPARPGMIAPEDVIVPAQATDLDPGPVIGDLNSAGVRTRIEKGKIRIVEDAVILKAGEAVSPTKASILLRLGILPFRAGLELEAVWEDGNVTEGAVLVVDTDATAASLREAFTHALGLALEIGYLSTATIPHLLTKAHLSALSLAIACDYPTAETVGQILTHGMAAAQGLAAQITSTEPDAMPGDSSVANAAIAKPSARGRGKKKSKEESNAGNLS